MTELVILYDGHIRTDYRKVISDLITHKQTTTPNSLLTLECLSVNITHLFRKKFSEPTEAEINEFFASICDNTDEKTDGPSLSALAGSVMKHMKFGTTTRKLFLIFTETFNITHPILTCKTFSALIRSCEPLGWRFVFLGADGSIGKELGCNISVTLNDANQETLKILRGVLDSFETPADIHTNSRPEDTNTNSHIQDTINDNDEKRSEVWK